MVWSNWRGAVVVMLAWVGLAWSQAPLPTSSGGTAERIMTVHENGKSLRCRVQSTWHMQDGSTAHQLQVMATGELMTIVENGPATTIQEPMLGKVKALPMRIFHWGRNRSAPPGVPVPPATIVTGDNRMADGNCGCDKCQAGSMRLASGTSKPGSFAAGNDRVVWWEEKNGQRVSPMIVTAGKNPFEQTPGVTLPGAPSPSSPLPVIVDQKANPVKGVDQVVPVPSPVVTNLPTVSIKPGTGEAMRMGTSSPMTRSVRPDGCVPMARNPVTNEGDPKIIMSQEKRPVLNRLFPGTKTVTTQPEPMPVIGTPGGKPSVTQIEPTMVPSQESPASTYPSTAPPGAKGPYVRMGPTFLPDKVTVPATTQPPVDNNQPQAAAPPGNTPAQKSPGAYVQPWPTTAQSATAKAPKANPTSDPVATNAQAASNTQPTVAKKPRVTLADKIHNWLHPKHEAPDTKQVAGAGKTSDKKSSASTAPATAAAVPFSTAAGSGTKSASSPQANTNPVAAAPAAVPGTREKVDDTKPAAKPATGRDWRDMWGQPKENKAQVPGQSLVDQASAKPDPKAPSLAQISTATPTNLPPTSMVEKKQGDILLNPEKFDPNGERLAPKGINMNSYRGDPTKSMQALQTPAALPNTSSLPSLSKPSALPPSGVPLGAQSVLAAGSNAPTRMTYVPVPVATVPEPYRPPVPPAPKMPEPPQPNAYVNAFTPPPPPHDKQTPNPMTVNAFSNMNPQPATNPIAQAYPHAPGYSQGPMANPFYQPNPMAQGYPMAPGYPPNPNVMMAQGMPNPYYYGPQVPQQPMMSPQGRPVAQINYPQNYQGPQAPNPNLPPMQPTPYAPWPTMQPMQQPTVNVAMDRRQMPGAPTPELIQIIQVLRESPYPAQREWASNTLATYEWRAHPEVVQVLLQAAQQDPAAIVRASCVYSLGRMNAASEPVVSTLYTLRNDADPRVRQEVEQALVRLGVGRQ